MTKQRTTFSDSRSLAGAALAGFGLFMLYENMAVASAWLGSVFGANFEALGILPAAILAVSQSLQAHAVSHPHFLQDVIRHMLVSCWPLLLVIAGTVLSRDTFSDTADALPQRNSGVVDLATNPSTLKFKARNERPVAGCS
jgi:hypothetical protein